MFDPLEEAARRASPNGRIDKSALPLSEPRRLRDHNHLRHVASKPVPRSVVATAPRPITSSSFSPMPWAARSPMSSLYPCAQPITGSCMHPATSDNGGRVRELILNPCQESCGGKVSAISAVAPIRCPSGTVQVQSGCLPGMNGRYRRPNRKRWHVDQDDIHAIGLLLILLWTLFDGIASCVLGPVTDGANPLYDRTMPCRSSCDEHDNG